MIVFRVIATVQRTIFYCLSSKVVLGSQSSLFSVGKFDSDLKEQCSQTIVFYRTFCRTFCTTFCRTLCRTYNSLSFASSTDMKFIECELPCVVNPIRDKAGHKENRISIFVVNMHSICIYIEWQWQSWAACHGHWACNEIKKLYFCICVELQQWLCWAACSG